jgi:hypothetical protein
MNWAQRAIDLMAEAWAQLASGNRTRAGELSQEAYRAAQMSGRADVAANVVASSENLWAEFAKQPAPGGGGEAPPPPGGGGGGADDALRQQLEMERQERLREQREAAGSFLRGVLSQYGMESLVPQVEALIGEWGTNTGVIAERLRQTSEYQTRFKGLVGLQKRGITDVRNEAEYIDLESRYRGVFREAGLRDFLGQSGTQSEYDAIAKIVGDYSLSVNEVKSRVLDAQRVAVDTPQEVRDALQRFYNVGAEDLVAYSLDPQRTMNRINEKANAAILGGFAARGGLDIGVGAAERVAGLAGAEDISLDRIQQDVMGAREVRDATRRLAEIERGTLSDEEALTAQAGVDPEASERIRTLQSRERARFGGSGAFDSRSLVRPRSV